MDSLDDPMSDSDNDIRSLGTRPPAPLDTSTTFSQIRTHPLGTRYYLAWYFQRTFIHPRLGQGVGKLIVGVT